MNASSPIPLSRGYSNSFLISIVFTFLVGILAPRSLAFLPSVLGLGFAVTIFAKHKYCVRPLKCETILIALILILAGISSFWSPDTAFSLERTGKTAIIFLPCLLLLAAAREIKWPSGKKIIYYLIALHFFIATFLFTEKILGHPIIEYVSGKDVYSFKLNRSFVVFSLFTLPLLFLTRSLNIDKIKKHLLLAFVIGSTALSLSQAESQTAQLCFIVAIILFFLYPVKMRKPIKIIGGLVLMTAFVFPFIVGPLKSSIPEEMLVSGILREASIIHRLEVWNFAAEHAINKPILGNGIGAIRFLKSSTYMEYQKADGALHAHNAALQVWTEFGLVGALLGMALLFYIFRNIYRTENNQARHLYLTVFVTTLCCAFTGYGLWQGWLLGMFFILTAFTIFTGRQISNKA